MVVWSSWGFLSFEVGFFSAENVVGGEVDEASAFFFTNLGHHLGGVDIDSDRKFVVVLTGLGSGEGGRIDEEVEVGLLQIVFEGDRVTEVNGGASERNDIVIWACELPILGESSSNFSGGASEKDFHVGAFWF